MSDLNFDIKSLPAEKRLALLGEIWDSLESDDIPMTEAQRKELDRRLDDLKQNPDIGISWEEVLRRIEARKA